jgi:DNA modification methylase
MSTVRDRVVGLERIRAGDLEDHPSNWRRHPRRQRAALRAVLEEIGWAGAVIARREGDRTILIDGHLRKSLHPDAPVPVLILDVSAEEAEQLLVTMDPIGALARPDPASLNDLLDRVRFSNDAVADLLEELARSATLDVHSLVADPDEAPASGLARTHTADVWSLGQHRLVCGDVTDRAVLERVMDGGQADILLTDPPFGVSYIGKTPDQLTIANDGADGIRSLLTAAFANVADVLADGAPIYVFSPAGPLHLEFFQAFVGAGWRFRQGLVWDKGAPVIGHGDYHFAHEPILFGYAPSPRGKGRGVAGWYGGDDKTSVIHVPKPARSREHPTMKPIELLRELISNSSRRHQVVLDPFLGSGSTLIASELLGRRCVGIEIDPRYCDVVLARFEAITGVEPTLVDRIG